MGTNVQAGLPGQESPEQLLLDDLDDLDDFDVLEVDAAHGERINAAPEEAEELEKPKDGEAITKDTAPKPDDAHDTLKYQLLGPSLTKAGQDTVDQTKVAEIIYNASRGSKFFHREEARDKLLTEKIDRILARKRSLTETQLTRFRREADALLEQLEATRDLSQYIVHVDCDAFYAAVEELDRPELKGVPFAVGKGVLTTCNYHARRFGVRSGMASFVATKLCPSLILIPNDHAKYRAKAAEVRDIFADYDPRFESASIDEAYLNITAYCAAHADNPPTTEEKEEEEEEREETGPGPGDPAGVVARMRKEIHERTGVTVSAGIAPNARLAKICSNINKPNGQFVLPNERAEIMRFVRDLPTRKVNGIGRVMERELAAVGIATLGDVYEKREYVKPLFGEKAYSFLMHAYLGLGRTRIQPAEEYVRKSVGTERTFRAIADQAELRDRLRKTAEDLEAELEKAGVKGRTVVLKVKLHTFEVLTRQVVAPKLVRKADDLYGLALPMLVKLEEEVKASPAGRKDGFCIRLMGIRCTHLVSSKKPDAAAFFGLRSKSSGVTGEGEASAKRRHLPELDSDGWEKWPQEEEEEVVEDNHHDIMTPTSPHNTDEPPPLSPPPKPDEDADEFWDCPVCARPQSADERLFNEHIDLCLSRQTIRDAVQEDGATAGLPGAERAPPVDTLSKKRRGRPRGSGVGERERKRERGDPRQRKLCFG